MNKALAKKTKLNLKPQLTLLLLAGLLVASIFLLGCTTTSTGSAPANTNPTQRDFNHGFRGDFNRADYNRGLRGMDGNRQFNPNDFNRRVGAGSNGFDLNFMVNRVKQLLGLPAATTNDQVKLALGLSETATDTEFRNAIMIKFRELNGSDLNGQ